mmetsp:Transcript_73113/g.117898  ORF Transcript_73113/g.117898 Transcript_73113/m.117898 type:complete len:193 (-) Transcript_73113:168-746(-)
MKQRLPTGCAGKWNLQHLQGDHQASQQNVRLWTMPCNQMLWTASAPGELERSFRALPYVSEVQVSVVSVAALLQAGLSKPPPDELPGSHLQSTLQGISRSLPPALETTMTLLPWWQHLCLQATEMREQVPILECPVFLTGATVAASAADIPLPRAAKLPMVVGCFLGAASSQPWWCKGGWGRCCNCSLRFPT